MGEFFGSIYCWFEDFFGLELANYLWGLSSSKTAAKAFIGIGMIMLGITLAIAVLYYYIINAPRLCTWWAWSIFGIVNAVVNFIVGWQWVLTDKNAGKMVTVDPVTSDTIELSIGQPEMLAFGVSNMILSLLAFVLISLAIKWWSNNCSHSPF